MRFLGLLGQIDSFYALFVFWEKKVKREQKKRNLSVCLSFGLVTCDNGKSSNKK